MKKIVNIKKSFPAADKQSLSEAVSFVGSTLRELGIKPNLTQKTELLSEETIVMFIRHAPEDAVLQVQIRRLLGDVSVNLSMRGEEFDPYSGPAESEAGPDADPSEDAIRAVLLRSHGEKYKYSHKNHVNSVRILTGQSEQSATAVTIAALVLGLLVGLLVKFALPASLADGLSLYLLDPIQTMFMNALKIVVAPVVFFSIVTCLSQFKNLSEFGKLGSKILGLFLLTTVLSVLLGIGVFMLFRPGVPGFALSGGIEAAAVAVDTNVDTGLLHMIVNIVPSNFLAPFLESDTLQLIFLAILCGVAVSAIGQYSSLLKGLFEACNSLFLTITAMITRFMPLVVFASVALMVINLGGSSLLAVLSGSGVLLLSLVGILAVYGLMILFMTRLNPLTFFQKNREGMLTSFLLSSSSAAMPVNMRICTDKLGISPKVANFSIPLGAILNKDGTTLFLVVLALFLARAYGVEPSFSALVSMGISVILLSLGAPSVPGASFVCMGIVLQGLNVPIEALGLIIAVSPILDMFCTLANTTGDVASALIVANSEKLLDRDCFRNTR